MSLFNSIAGYYAKPVASPAEHRRCEAIAKLSAPRSGLSKRLCEAKTDGVVTF